MAFLKESSRRRVVMAEWTTGGAEAGLDLEEEWEEEGREASSAQGFVRSLTVWTF